MNRFALGVTLACILTAGIGIRAQTPPNEARDAGQQQFSGRMAAILMSADDQAKKLTVWGVIAPERASFAGNEGAGGEQQHPTQADLQQYSVQTDEKTFIHWQGTQDRITLSQLKEMCKEGNPRNIRLAVTYDGPITNNTLTAKEIGVNSSQQQQREGRQ